jgi:RNase P/RNase MRP subunit POP5
MTPHPRIRIIEYNAVSGVGILLCDHKSLPQLRKVFHKLSTPSATPHPIHLLGVSGTLKTLRQKFLDTKHAPVV